MWHIELLQERRTCTPEKLHIIHWIPKTVLGNLSRQSMWTDATYMMARPHSRPARADNGGMDPVPLARYARSKDGDALKNAKATRAGSPPEDIITAHVCVTVIRQSVASVTV